MGITEKEVELFFFLSADFFKFILIIKKAFPEEFLNSVMYSGKPHQMLTKIKPTCHA
jgi:hypothetical protein